MSTLTPLFCQTTALGVLRTGLLEWFAIVFVGACVEVV